MMLNEVIDQIECEMVCANRCPQWNKAPYDRTKCRCYKRECIEVVEQSVIDINKLQAEQNKSLACLHKARETIIQQAEEIRRLEDETTDLNNTIGFMQTGLDDWKAKSDKQAEEIRRLKEALHRIRVWTEPNFKVITSVMSTIIENVYDVANKALLKGETELDTMTDEDVEKYNYYLQFCINNAKLKFGHDFRLCAANYGEIYREIENFLNNHNM